MMYNNIVNKKFPKGKKELIMAKKRYAQVGVGGRARMYYKAIAEDFSETSELVALCDINSIRMDYTNEVLEKEFGYHKLPTYGADEFEKMIEEPSPT